MRAAEARKLLKQFDIAGASEPANIRQFDGSGNFAYLLLMCALSVPSPPGSQF